MNGQGYWRFQVLSWDAPVGFERVAIAATLCLNECYIDIFDCIRAAKLNDGALRATLSWGTRKVENVFLSLNDATPTPAGTKVWVVVTGTLPEISRDELDQGVTLRLCEVPSPDGSQPPRFEVSIGDAQIAFARGWRGLLR